jgi:hypothetical protein
MNTIWHRRKESHLNKFEELLKQIPKPGVGANYHTFIFGVACRGHEAGLPDEEIFDALRKHTPEGGRVITDRELLDAVQNSKSAKDRIVKPYAGPRIRPDFLAECLRNGKGASMDDIAANSPVKLDWDEEEGWRALEYLYDEDDLLFIGDDKTPGKLGSSIRSREEWCSEFECECAQYPKLIPNPLTGYSAPTKSGGGFTLRGDGCVAAHRFATAESDSLSLEDQCAFWMGCHSLPVAALIFSGSKSIHAWLRVDCADVTEWESRIAGELFPGFLIPLGMDPACKNPARLSRMPGYYRPDKDTVQRLIYLAPEGKAVAA